jgi:hypothetical protein
MFALKPIPSAHHPENEGPKRPMGFRKKRKINEPKEHMISFGQLSPYTFHLRSQPLLHSYRQQ